MRRVVLPSMFVMLALAGTVLAHEGHEHKMMGTVTAIDTKQIVITTKDDQKAIIVLDSDTKYFRGKSDATAAEVKLGGRVAITAVEKDGKMVAREVHLATSK